MFKIAVGVLLYVSLAYAYLGCGTFDKAYCVIDDLISEDASRIPGFVRLAFHDCVGKACDGCLNLDDPGNAGLADDVKTLEEAWYDNHFSKEISRADFWQLAGQVALVRGGLNRKKDRQDYGHPSTFPYFQFWWGRRDCKTAPYTHAIDGFPDAHGDFREVDRVLHGDFGLNREGVVALLGAHSLGGGHVENSGFKYNWQDTPFTFDNSYFQNLISLPFTQKTVSNVHHTPHIEFVSPPSGDDDDDDVPLLMLNTDISIWKNIKSLRKDNDFTGDVVCPFAKHNDAIRIKQGIKNQISDCEDAPTYRYVEKFAKDLEEFDEEFSVAWWKMSVNGCDDLEKPGYPHEKCGDCIPKGAYCVPGFSNSGQCCHGYSCEDHKCQ